MRIVNGNEILCSSTTKNCSAKQIVRAETLRIIGSNRGIRVVDSKKVLCRATTGNCLVRQVVKATTLRK